MLLTTLAPFTASDGENLALYEWEADDSDTELAACQRVPRGVVLIVHGLGEHAGRYHHVARQLMSWGFVVRAYDQRGHGESGGARGAVPTETALLDDLADVMDFSRNRCRDLVAAAAVSGISMEAPPLILLGHSLGGLVASRLVALKLRPVEGLVLSSPALDAGLSGMQKMLLGLALRVRPTLSAPNRLDPNYISRDLGVVKAYRADPLVHNRISPRLGRFIATAGPAIIAAAPGWTLPTLLMYAGADRLVNPAGSARFVQQACPPAVAPGTVTACRFDGMYHELFNEVDTQPVFGTLRRWLDAKFA